MITNTRVYIVIGVVVSIIISLFIIKSIEEKKQKDKQIVKEIRYIHLDNKKSEKKVDSLLNVIEDLSKNKTDLKNKENNIRTEYKNIYIEKPANNDCSHLYEDCTHKIALMEKTILIKDSIENNLNEQLSLKDAIIDQKDNIISNKDKEIKLTKELNKPRNKKFGIGIQVGTGISGFNSNNNTYSVQYTPVYVGVGISYNPLTF